MKTIGTLLSATRIKRIREQGYFTKSDQEIIDLAFGNRFAYQVCTILFAFGLTLASIPFLSVVMGISLTSVILPNHLFDYIYNYVLSERMQLPKLSKRAPQLKFACTIATFWIGATIYMFHSGNQIAGYVVGGVFLMVAIILSTTDLCLPSIIYNKIFKKE